MVFSSCDIPDAGGGKAKMTEAASAAQAVMPRAGRGGYSSISTVCVGPPPSRQATLPEPCSVLADPQSRNEDCKQAPGHKPCGRKGPIRSRPGLRPTWE